MTAKESEDPILHQSPIPFIIFIIPTISRASKRPSAETTPTAGSEGLLGEGSENAPTRSRESSEIFHTSIIFPAPPPPLVSRSFSTHGVFFFLVVNDTSNVSRPVTDKALRLSAAGLGPKATETTHVGPIASGKSSFSRISVDNAGFVKTLSTVAGVGYHSIHQTR